MKEEQPATEEEAKQSSAEKSIKPSGSDVDMTDEEEEEQRRQMEQLKRRSL